MNKNETGDSTSRNIHLEESKGSHETSLCDLEPRAEIKAGSIHKVTDVTLKRGVVG